MKKKIVNDLFFRRLFAFVFDNFLILIISSFICLPFLDYDSINNLDKNANELFIDYYEENIDIDVYMNSSISILYRLAEKQGLLSFIEIFLCILYFVIYQFYNDGQTFGKKIFGIRVVSNNSNELTIDNYIFRSFIVNSILFNMISFAFLIFMVDELWFSSVIIVKLINYIILLICGFMIMSNNDCRGLHDFIGNTKVIQYRK